MAEQGLDKPKTAEEQGKILIEFARSAEFGSAQYNAISDYLELESLEESLGIVQSNALEKRDDEERTKHWENMAQIDQLKIALLEHEISQNNSRIKGYESAYVHIAIGFEDLRSTASKEAEAKFPNDEILQETEEQSIYDKTHTQFETTISDKRE